MQLLPIDKKRYCKRLNRISVCSIVVLILLSLGSSALLIRLFADGQSSNFYFNLAGVIIACIVVGFSLKRLKQHPYFSEVAYIWDLKHELNLIQRKLKAIEQAAANNNATALLILAYSYAGSRLIWQLDDNTLVLSELNQADNRLQQQIADAGISIDITHYQRQLLAQF